MLKRNKLNINDTLRVYPIALAAYFIAALLATLTWTLPLTLFDNLSDSLNLGTWAVQILSTVSLFLVCFLYCQVTNVNFTKAVGFTKKIDVKALIIGMVGIIGLICFVLPLANFFIEGLDLLLEELGKEPLEISILPESPYLAWDIIISIIAGCILPGFCEEVLMRGVIAQGLNTKMGKIGASLISGLIFMLFHMNPAQTVYQFVIGFVLGYIMLTTRCIWIPIILHVFNNTLSVVLDYTMPEALQITVFLDYWYITMAVGAVIVGVSVVFYILHVKKSGEKDEVESETESENEPEIETQVQLEEPVFAELEEPQIQTQTSQENQTNQSAEELAQTEVGAAGLVFSVIAATICCLVWIITLFVL